MYKRGYTYDVYMYTHTHRHTTSCTCTYVGEEVFTLRLTCKGLVTYKMSDLLESNLKAVVARSGS